MNIAHTIGVSIDSSDLEGLNALERSDERIVDEHAGKMIFADGRTSSTSYFTLGLLKSLVKVVEDVEKGDSPDAREDSDDSVWWLSLKVSLGQEGLLKIRTPKREYFLAPRKKEAVDWIEAEALG